MFVTVYITVADYWKLKKDTVLKFYSRPDLYEKYFAQCVLPEIGMMKIVDVSLSDMERAVRNMFAAGNSKYKVSMMCAVIRKLFHQAAFDRLVNEDIFKGLKSITPDKSEKRVLSHEQEVKLLRAFQFTKQPELYTLCMFTGIPCSTLTLCAINDYSRDNRTLTIFRKPNQYYAQTRNFNANARTIPLSEISCRVIEVAIRKQQDKNKNFPDHESNLIFTGAYNNEITKTSHEDYMSIRKHSGLYDFHMIDIVSNFGINALKHKVNPIVLKRYSGYKSDYSVNMFALAYHNNIRDIQASDDYYRELAKQ